MCWSAESSASQNPPLPSEGEGLRVVRARVRGLLPLELKMTPGNTKIQGDFLFSLTPQWSVFGISRWKRLTLIAWKAMALSAWKAEPRLVGTLGVDGGRGVRRG